jgi:hypothetical protein
MNEGDIVYKVECNKIYKVKIGLGTCLLYNYHKTFQEAKESKLKYIDNCINTLKETLEKYEKEKLDLNKIKEEEID